MSDDRTFSRAIDDLLDGGPDRAPRRALDAVLIAVARTPQDGSLRPRWRPAAPAATTRYAVLLGLAVLLLGLAGFVINGGGQSAVPPSAPSSSTNPGESTPSTPVPSATLQAMPFESQLWTLDFASSGLSTQPLGTTGGDLGSSLRFTPNGVDYNTGYGGGCDTGFTTYTMSGPRLSIAIAPTGGRCAPGSAHEIRARLSRVASFTIETCDAIPSPVQVALRACPILRLYDASSTLLLVYRGRPGTNP